jgi:hypothetical protein
MSKPIKSQKLGIVSIPRPVRIGYFFLKPEDRDSDAPISTGGAGQVDYRKSDEDAWYSSRKIGFTY